MCLIWRKQVRQGSFKTIHSKNIMEKDKLGWWRNPPVFFMKPIWYY